MAKIKTGKARLEEWIEFLSGHWTMKKPKHVGTYPVAEKDTGGNTSGIPACGTTVTLYSSSGKLLQANDEKWQGWWWSKPFPTLPPTPDTKWEKK